MKNLGLVLIGSFVLTGCGTSPEITVETSDSGNLKIEAMKTGKGTSVEEVVVIPTESMNIINTKTMENGLQLDTLKEGTGAAAKAGDNLRMHYTGTLTDGTKFDSSLDRGDPFNFTLGAGQVIKGWDLGIEGMKVGEKRKLTIPSDLGYGAQGIGPIPGGATLIFDVELIEIVK